MPSGLVILMPSALIRIDPEPFSIEIPVPAVNVLAIGLPTDDPMNSCPGEVSLGKLQELLVVMHLHI